MGDSYWELQCPDCSWAEVCGREGVARWLRVAKKVRAGREPEWEIMVELLGSAAGQLTCPRCGRTGLSVRPAPDDLAWDDDPICSSCSRPIPRERLEAVPGTRVCAACQRAEESGQPVEIEYCPRCGAPMQLRLSRSAGVSHYTMVCTAEPPCRL